MIGQTAGRLADIAGNLKRALRIAGGISPSVAEGIVPTIRVWDATEEAYATRHRFAINQNVIGDATHTGYLAVGNFSTDHSLTIDAITVIDNTGASIVELTYQPNTVEAGVDFTKAILKNSRWVSSPGGNLEYADNVGIANLGNANGSGQSLEVMINQLNVPYHFESLPIVLDKKPLSYLSAQRADWLRIWVNANTHSIWICIQGHYDP